MNHIEALKEAITALINSEIMSRRCAQERFTDEVTKTHWIQAADRAGEAKVVLADVLQCIETGEF